MKLLSLITLSLLPIVFGSSDERPVVEAPSGKYRGHILKSRNGRDILAFQGIPYVKPPVGELRFKDPVAMPKLEGIFEADKDGQICFQPIMSFTQQENISTFHGEEDCLYLNVYKPKIEDEDKKLPVLVWIHGGAYYMGSGSYMWMAPSYYMDRDMIFVAMNYRLGILGYFSTGDHNVPGNFGMKDMVMSLKWVQENIAAFGGDPNLVTIAGASSGASAVSLLMHSPLSKGLFHRVIAQGGTAHCPFSTKLKQKVKTDSKKIADYLGCSEDSEQLLTCLQKMPVKEVYKASQSIIPPFVQQSIDFTPVIEDESPSAFLTESSYNEPSKIPLMTGVAKNECMNLITVLMLPIGKYGGNKTLMYANIEDYIEDALPFWAGYNDNPKEKEITEAIMKFYYGENGVKDATELKTIDICSDLIFNYGTKITGKVEKGPTYIYKFSYKGSGAINLPGASIPEGLEDGVGHGADSLYLMDIPIFSKLITFSEEDLKMSNQMIDIWYNFIKTGDPTPESKLWKESEGGVNYLEFTNNGLHMKANMFQSRLEFLDTLHIDRSLLHQ